MPTTAPTSGHGDTAIDLTNVSKRYPGGVHALQGIDMRVRRGEIFGLLGPNGAGKSTLVKILLTVIRPTRAEGSVLGFPIGHKPTLARVGYLPEHHRFPEYLTGAQVIDFYGALARTPRPQRRRLGAALLDLVGMTAWADKRVKGYSKGMRQRIGIAQALVNDPDLVVLDEPTDGVDPVGRRDIRQVVSRLRDEGRTVFLNSHLLSELEMVCDRVAILVQGRVASHGTIDELTKDRQYYELTLAGEPTAVHDSLVRALPPQASPARPGHDGFLTPDISYAFQPSGLRIYTTDARAVQGLIDTLRAKGDIIRLLRPVRPSLEDLFMEAVTDPLTGATLAPGAGPLKPKGKPHARNGGAA